VIGHKRMGISRTSHGCNRLDPQIDQKRDMQQKGPRRLARLLGIGGYFLYRDGFGWSATVQEIRWRPGRRCCWCRCWGWLASCGNTSTRSSKSRRHSPRPPGAGYCFAAPLGGGLASRSCVEVVGPDSPRPLPPAARIEEQGGRPSRPHPVRRKVPVFAPRLAHPGHVVRPGVPRPGRRRSRFPVHSGKNCGVGGGAPDV
jgi:hypothetical protein